MFDKITNEMFENAWADENNRRIIASVCQKYRGRIPPDELTRCGYIALLNCLHKHDVNQCTKFTSSLYKHTSWQCSKTLRKIMRDPHWSPLPENLEAKSQNIYLWDCMNILSPDDTQILHNYYFEGMTLREIGKVNGYTATTALRRLRNAKAAFRRLYGGD